MLCGYWGFCVAYIDTVSIGSITARYGRSKLVNVVSGVLQSSVLGPLLFLLYTSELFSILENKLIGYADNSTLIAVVPSPALELQWQSPCAVTSLRLVRGVTFGG